MTASHRWITYLTAALATVGTQNVDAADILAVESGLTAYQVVQCDDAGRAVVELAGRIEAADAAVQARVQKGAETVRDWTDCARPEAGKWTAHFDAIPAGGPYTVELRAKDAQGQDIATKAIEHVLVGDLWVLAGQSNMQGVGNNVDVTPPSDQVNVFAMNDTWRIAEEPIHRLEESPDFVHNAIEDDAKRQGLVADTTNWTKGAGLGLPFAVELSRLTGRPVGLVACAHGGTSMGQWDPAKRDEAGRSLYGSMYRRFKAVGGKVRGVLWYQGESDANPDAAPIFADLFKNIVQSMRTDFGNAELPFYYVQIGRFTNPADAKDWNKAQQIQLDCESQIPHSAMITAVNLSLDDGIHVGTQGLKVLGAQFAKIAARDLFKVGTVQNGPRPVSAKRNGTPFGLQLLVTFSGVNGGLKSDGRVAGFSVSDAEGKPLPNVYDAEISPEDPNTVIVWLSEAPAGTKLWYGRGFDPYCNVTDKEGMGVPVFGPMEISD